VDDLELSLRRLGSRGRGAVAAGVVRGGERAFGCWFPRARPVDPRSRFEIGSITKAFTGVLLADMVLAGEVALDDPLSRHLRYPRPAWRGREPTLLELATHRSGLPNSPGAVQRRELAFAAGLRRADPWAGVTREDYDRLASAESPRREPGGRMRYSSLGVGLLGDALAARAGTSYEELLAERVLRPLGMAQTGVQPAGAVVPGHSRRGRPRPPLHDHMPGAGSLRSSAEDMLRFLAACLRPPAERLGPALALAQQPHARLARGAQIGLGWMLVAARRDRPRIVWHNGATWGFRSFAGFSPGSGSAVVVLSSAPRPVERAGFRLLK
jgi:CubicO group peptidase (beta-lactamase class C family)